MSDDEVVSHDEVLPWLSPAVQREWVEAERARILALPPEERGWWTADEAAELPGEWIEITTFSEREPRYIRGRR
jgi:hypothetical protein